MMSQKKKKHLIILKTTMRCQIDEHIFVRPYYTLKKDPNSIEMQKKASTRQIAQQKTKIKNALTF